MSDPLHNFTINIGNIMLSVAKERKDELEAIEDICRELEQKLKEDIPGVPDYGG